VEVISNAEIEVDRQRL